MPEPATSGKVEVTAFVDRHLLGGGRIEELYLPARRTVVVCPHPDDEALATGGLIARQMARGVAVLIIAVTDGEAAFSRVPDPALASVRRGEQSESLRRLGHDPAQTVRLGLPDGSVGRHEGDISKALTQLVASGDLLVAPSCHDWHPDHEACGRAAGIAAAKLGCDLLGSLFWAHHHPGSIPPGAVLAVLSLREDERQRRLAAVSAHQSQLSPGTPVVEPKHLRHLDRPVEFYLMAQQPIEFR